MTDTPPAAEVAAQVVATWIGQMTEVGQRRFVWGSVTDKEDLIAGIADALTTALASVQEELEQVKHGNLLLHSQITTLIVERDQARQERDAVLLNPKHPEWPALNAACEKVVLERTTKLTTRLAACREALRGARADLKNVVELYCQPPCPNPNAACQSLCYGHAALASIDAVLAAEEGG